MSKGRFKYVHWLKIDLTNETDEGIEWNNLKKYRESYNCNMSVFYYNSNPLIAKAIKLECNQSYNDLDLDVNSMSDGSLIRLTRKPKNISPYSQDIDYFFKRKIINTKLKIVDKKIPTDICDAEYPYGENIIYDEELQMEELDNCYNDGRIRVIISKDETNNYYSIYTYSFEDCHNAGYCYGYFNITQDEFDEMGNLNNLVYEVVTGEKDRFTGYGIGISTGITEESVSKDYNNGEHQI